MIAPPRIPRTVWIIALICVSVRVWVSAYSQFTSEDFLITLRCAENLARGNGMVFNPGERVLGTTTPLYTLLLALFVKAGLPAALLGKALNIAADGALSIISWRWLAGLQRERAGLIAAAAIAVNPIQIQWAVSGMEASIVTLLGTVVWMLYAERREVPSWIAAAVLFLFRWDGLLIAITLFIAATIRDRRVPWKGGALLAAICAPWIVIAWLYFGSPIPVTAAAKSVVYGWRADLDPNPIHRMLPSLPKLLFRIYGTPVYAAAALFALLGLVVVIRKRIHEFLPPTIWFFIYWGAFLASRVLLFPWYLAPPMPVYGGFAAIGIDSVTEKLKLSRAALTACGVVLFAVCLIAGTGLAARQCRREQYVEEKVRIPLALWMKDHARPTDRVMLEPIGYVGYYSGLRVIDVVGLVSPNVLDTYRIGAEAPMLEMADRLKPEWCVLRPGEIDRIRRACAASRRRWEDNYDLRATFELGRFNNTYFIFERKERPK